MDLGLLQKDVSGILQVTEHCIMNWETGKSEPQIQYAPKIIQFLGYNPYDTAPKTLSGRIKHYRLLHGLSHKKMGKLVGVDAATISTWETGKHRPNKEMLERINMLLESAI